MKKRIAILGSTGHIAKGLIDNLGPDHDLVLYSRSRDMALGFFPIKGPYDAVINCIGVREALWTDPYQIFRTTEIFDNMVMDYIHFNPDTLAINLSSGAIYGGSFEQPATPGTKLAPDTPYGIAKLNSEAKHRARNNLNIVDIRVFSYFSRYLPPDSLCLMSEILSSLRTGTPLKTSPRDFMRDYIHPKDLAALIGKCIELGHMNTALDAYTLLPVGKFELLDSLANSHGLKYEINPDWIETSPTGPKLNYYSNNLAAAEIGYFPQYSAMNCITGELEALLETR